MSLHLLLSSLTRVTPSTTTESGVPLLNSRACPVIFSTIWDIPEGTKWDGLDESFLPSVIWNMSKYRHKLSNFKLLTAEQLSVWKPQLRSQLSFNAAWQYFVFLQCCVQWSYWENVLSVVGERFELDSCSPVPGWTKLLNKQRFWANGGAVKIQNPTFTEQPKGLLLLNLTMVIKSSLLFVCFFNATVHLFTKVWSSRQWSMKTHCFWLWHCYWHTLKRYSKDMSGRSKHYLNTLSLLTR